MKYFNNVVSYKFINVIFKKVDFSIQNELEEQFVAQLSYIPI